jgi:dTDP-4-dehydrorhamnose reductase
MRRPLVPPLALWAGLECTVNRVGDAYFDQLQRNGHADHIEDLDRFASLGVRTIRYPVLWERTAPRALEDADWSWADARLGRLRELGMAPIVGLVHHGSGPAHTSLVDPGFAVGLARFARAVAERYPWVDAFTPVNEPVTTARFSGLYGHWFPHGRDTTTFVRALLTQCRATVLAMRAIRTVIPHAALVQTEDMGRTFSTPALAGQAEHENARRLLSLDLLTGRVDRTHPLWSYLRRHGAMEVELLELVEAPCPPDVIGLNYYITSDRFLDERVERYPAWSHGGNGRQPYADVEAVRAWPDGHVLGHEALLTDAWKRYRLPVAITEAHLGATREDQLRWLMEAWRAAHAARAGGADVRAVTVWSLLGAFDWNRLVVRDDGVYEPGVFDLRAPKPRPTAIATMARALAGGPQHYDHPVLATRGWWRRPGRIVYGIDPACTTTTGSTDVMRQARPLLITGASGTLGRAFARICETRGLAYRLLSRAEMDIADPRSVQRLLDEAAPWAVVNTAGYVRVDEAESDGDRCHRENARGPAILAAACAGRDTRLVTFSSDLVFDGAQARPYLESDRTAPLGVYGITKAEAEREVLRRMPDALVIRTSAFFGPWDEHNFMTSALRTLAGGHCLRAACDTVVSPTYVPDLVHATLDLLVDGEAGLWHLANQGAVTWAELGRQGARLAGLDAALVEDCATADLGFTASRPPYSALGTERGALLPPLEESLQRYVRERDPGRI